MDFGEASAHRPSPKYKEIATALGGAQSGWHIFGVGDQIGMLNLQTTDRVLSASRLVLPGEVFSLNLDFSLISPPLFRRGEFAHTVIDDRTGNSFDNKLDNRSSLIAE